jgi:hypothetical protein
LGKWYDFCMNKLPKIMNIVALVLVWGIVVFMFGGFFQDFSIDSLNPSSSNGFGIIPWIFFLIALSSTIYTFTNQRSKKARYDSDVNISDSKNRVFVLLVPLLYTLLLR